MTFNFETNLQAYDTAIRALTFNGTHIVSADQSGIVRYFQPKKNNLTEWPAHREAVRSLGFSPDDVRFATAIDDSTVRVWFHSKNREERVLTGHRWDINCIEWSGIRPWACSWCDSKDNLLQFWGPTLEPRSRCYTYPVFCLVTYNKHIGATSSSYRHKDTRQALACAHQHHRSGLPSQPWPHNSPSRDALALDPNFWALAFHQLDQFLVSASNDLYHGFSRVVGLPQRDGGCRRNCMSSCGTCSGDSVPQLCRVTVTSDSGGSQHPTSDSAPRTKTIWQLFPIACENFDSLELTTVHRCARRSFLFPSFSSPAYLLGRLVYVLRHGYTPAEQSRAASVLRRNICKAHVDVRFNSLIAFDYWCPISAIANGNVNIDVCPWAGGERHRFPTGSTRHVSRLPGGHGVSSSQRARGKEWARRGAESVTFS